MEQTLTQIWGTNPYTLNLSYTEPGFQRGNPNNKDSYGFVVVSVYKKLKNQTKSYRTINMYQKRKIKAPSNEEKHHKNNNISRDNPYPSRG